MFAAVNGLLVLVSNRCELCLDILVLVINPTRGLYHPRHNFIFLLREEWLVFVFPGGYCESLVLFRDNFLARNFQN